MDEQSQVSVELLNKTFRKLKIDAETRSCITVGPLQRFSVYLKGDTQIAKLVKFSKEIEMSMKAIGQPLILEERDENGAATSFVQLDIMTAPHPTVDFDALVEETNFKNPEILKKFHIPILVGTTEISKPMIVDLQSMPHLIVVGVTGSGKSMFLHSVVRSIEAHSQNQGIRLALVDPKLVEFGCYEGSSALKYTITGSHDGALEILEYLEQTLNTRLEVLAKNRCRDILEYRALRESLPEKERGPKMPFIVAVIDEIADLVRQPKSPFQALLISVASKSRAAGIHFVIGTQHSSAQVITGLLKAQFPGRVGMKTATGKHSEVALDQRGAEKLLGSGDGLFLNSNGSLTRFKGAFVKPQPKKKRALLPKQVEKKGFFEKMLDAFAK